MFSDPNFMHQVMETVGTVLYERLRAKYNNFNFWYYAEVVCSEAIYFVIINNRIN